MIRSLAIEILSAVLLPAIRWRLMPLGAVVGVSRGSAAKVPASGKAPKVQRYKYF